MINYLNNKDDKYTLFHSLKYFQKIYLNFENKNLIQCIIFPSIWSLLFEFEFIFSINNKNKNFFISKKFRFLHFLCISDIKIFIKFSFHHKK